MKVTVTQLSSALDRNPRIEGCSPRRKAICVRRYDPGDPAAGRSDHPGIACLARLLSAAVSASSRALHLSPATVEPGKADTWLSLVCRHKCDDVSQLVIRGCPIFFLFWSKVHMCKNRNKLYI